MPGEVSVEKLRARGRALADLGRWDAAESALREALSLDPRDYDALMQLARCLSETNRLQEALAALADARAARPREEWPHRFESYVYARLGRREEALASAREAVRLAPSVPETYQRLGGAAWNVGRREEALSAYARATRLALARDDFAASHGWALGLAGRKHEARRELRRALTLAPAKPSHHASLAAWYDGEQSLSLLRRAVALDPGDAEYFRRLASQLCGLLRYDEALEAIDQAYAAPRSLAEDHAALAALLVRASRARPAAGLEILARHGAVDRPVVGAWSLAARSVLRGLAGDGEGAAADATRAREALAAQWRPQEFCAWLTEARCYEQAADEGRALLSLGLTGRALHDAECAWLAAVRHAGQILAALPEFRRRYPDECPPHLAPLAYAAFRGCAPELALSAARVCAATRQEESWPVRVAGMQARLGDFAPLRAQVRRAKREGRLAAELYWACTVVNRHADAGRMAARALAFAPSSREALDVLAHAWMRKGDLAKTERVAQVRRERYPSEHTGAEDLAVVCARTLRVDEALAHSAVALEQAPFCHKAWSRRAVALLLAGRRDEARAHAERSRAVDGSPPGVDESEDPALVLAACAGDAATLARRLAERQDLPRAFKARLRAIAAEYAPDPRGSRRPRARRGV